jgi:hypothetical protein
MAASTSAVEINSHGLAGSVAVLIVGCHESADDEGLVLPALLLPEEGVLAASDAPPHAVAIEANETSTAQGSHRLFGCCRFMQRIVWTGSFAN